MKRFLLSSLLIPLLIASCGGSETTEGENSDGTDTSNVDYSGMSEMPLKDHGLNMKIMLPNVESNVGSAIEPKVEHEDGDYLWHVKIGPKFHLIIEDFGKEKNKVANEKARLDDLSRIFVVEYIEDNENLIMYKRTLHEDQGGQTTYHCYGETTIDGYTYVLRSEEEGNFRPIIEDMVKTIKSAKPIGAS
ncbi:hypothetical protein K6119_13485 [Paracrocinitomix mangrovi]|uniref:hypothetical protein n=1 Tax=Paracrocinitomix mangrovi TaxID=2862509 RepID=UPI001C8E5467|nr:hypothetical protein [Paracrocinitomix mangrovi]UKN00744.1 hypothetical protein K6119_13485 [Paracrocinitomix mangrovi]